MGFGGYRSNDYKSYSKTHSFDTRRAEEVINRTSVNNDFLPPNFKNGFREARDSAEHPTTTPIIIAGDVTGSMGVIAGLLLKEGLDTFCQMLYKLETVPHPTVMGMAVGDTRCDQYPIQCTQFEADIRIIKQFHELYVEGGGGGNDTESYSLPWIIAASMIKTDNWEKRGEKGILFTYGDEEAPDVETLSTLERYLGGGIFTDLITPRQALTAASEMYDIYHFVIEQGSYASYQKDRVYASWRHLLGQRVVPVTDYRRLAEIMISILEVDRKKRDRRDVAASWDGAARSAVATALSLPPVR